MPPIRLLNTSTYRLEEYHKISKSPNFQRVPYAILSHRWLTDPDEEVVFEDMTTFEQMKQTRAKCRSAGKIMDACRAARDQRKAGRCFEYIWIDTCCIDKKNAVELSESINSMYRWYKDADLCLVHLRDHDSTSRSSDAMKDIWFTRGWTLQELVAPKVVRFFDCQWISIGDRRSLQDKISTRTGIDRDTLLGGNVAAKSIAHRMSWFRDRTTFRPEDSAYCLIGFFGVNMPLLYGEGLEKAFRRLQEEIMKLSDDHSLFAWHIPDRSDEESRVFGLLAPSPNCFGLTGNYHFKPNPSNVSPFTMTNKGLSIALNIMEVPNEPGTYIASLDCPIGADSFLGIFLKCTQPQIGRYSRTKNRAGKDVCKIKIRGDLKSIYVSQPIDI